MTKVKYPVVRLDNARDWWFSWRAKCEECGTRVDPPEINDVEYIECSGGSSPDEEMMLLVSSLSELYDSVDSAAPELDTNRFEARAAELMHRGLTESPALADPEFWIWCSVSAGAKLIARRYPLKSDGLSPESMGTRGEEDDEMGGRKKVISWIPDKANFFSASARETLFYRLWIRGRLGFVEGADDPYELARCGDVDFWRSHIFRQMSLESAALRVEFIRFQFPDGADGKPRLSQSQIRKLIKRIRRAAANVVVDAFNDEQAGEFIMRQWQSMER